MFRIRKGPNEGDECGRDLVDIWGLLAAYMGWAISIEGVGECGNWSWAQTVLFSL